MKQERLETLLKTESDSAEVMSGGSWFYRLVPKTRSKTCLMIVWTENVGTFRWLVEADVSLCHLDTSAVYMCILLSVCSFHTVSLSVFGTLHCL